MTEDLQAQLINDLVAEGNEALDQFDQELLALEKADFSDATLNVMFRVIHTLKGSGGCLGLRQIEALAHAGESVMCQLREHVLPVTPGTVNLLLACSDGLRAILGRLATNGEEGDHDHGRLIGDLRLLSSAQSQAPYGQAEAYGIFDRAESAAEETGREQAYGLFDRAYSELGETPSQPNGNSAERPKVKAPANTAETVIRVDVQQLDGMMDLVGELVLARNQILQTSAKLNDSTLAAASQRLNVITSKLQETVMKTRMQPIGNVWNKFPRIVRDIAKDLGKQVRLEMEGNETDLDRNIIEAIKDPLIHLIRNSVDHGLETPERRIAAGKPAEGVVRLSAFHEGGQVIIEIFDDGAGIDRWKVLNKAIERNLIPAASASGLSDTEVFSLLFLPGFSTAQQVTNLSGRGVGLDVVKSNIERVGGSVAIHSESGRSTLFRIRIPLTLAIIQALLVTCGGHCYAIPQANLVELVRIDSEQRAKLVEHVNGVPVYRLRGSLLPLIYLSEELRIPPAAGTREQSTFLLVLLAEGRQFGLVVDAINDTEEIVVKPLGKELKNLPIYAGATIMGDGRVSLILDVPALARRAGIVDGPAAELIASSAISGPPTVGADIHESTLLFSLGQGRQAAISLSNVVRLEDFNPRSVEAVCGGNVIQYRGQIMPLLNLSEALGMERRNDDSGGPLNVIVYTHRGRGVGLIVHRILDTVEGEVLLQKISLRPGVLGSAIVRSRVTDFIDTDGLIEQSGVTRSEEVSE